MSRIGPSPSRHCAIPPWAQPKLRSTTVEKPAQAKTSSRIPTDRKDLIVIMGDRTSRDQLHLWVNGASFEFRGVGKNRPSDFRYISIKDVQKYVKSLIQQGFFENVKLKPDEKSTRLPVAISYFEKEDSSSTKNGALSSYQLLIRQATEDAKRLKNHIRFLGNLSQYPDKVYEALARQTALRSRDGIFPPQLKKVLIHTHGLLGRTDLGSIEGIISMLFKRQIIEPYSTVRISSCQVGQDITLIRALAVKFKIYIEASNDLSLGLVGKSNNDLQRIGIKQGEYIDNEDPIPEISEYLQFTPYGLIFNSEGKNRTEIKYHPGPVTYIKHKEFKFDSSKSKHPIPQPSLLGIIDYIDGVEVATPKAIGYISNKTNTQYQAFLMTGHQIGQPVGLYNSSVFWIKGRNKNKLLRDSQGFLIRNQKLAIKHAEELLRLNRSNPLFAKEYFYPADQDVQHLFLKKNMSRISTLGQNDEANKINEVAVYFTRLSSGKLIFFLKMPHYIAILRQPQTGALITSQSEALAQARTLVQTGEIKAVRRPVVWGH